MGCVAVIVVLTTLSVGGKWVHEKFCCCCLFVIVQHLMTTNIKPWKALYFHINDCVLCSTLLFVVTATQSQGCDVINRKTLLLKFALFAVFWTHQMMCACNFRFGAVWSEYTIRLYTICLPPRAAQQASLHLWRSTSHFATWTLKSWLSTTVYLFMLFAFNTRRSHLLDFCFGVCSGPGLHHGC